VTDGVLKCAPKKEKLVEGRRKVRKRQKEGKRKSEKKYERRN
jgi:hypothetical protein